MNLLKELKVFNDTNLQKNAKILEEPAELHTSIKSTIVPSNPNSTTQKKDLVIEKFNKIYGNKLGDYVENSMTEKELCLYEEAFLLDSENPKRLRMLNLSEKQLEQMVRCFRQYVDLAEEIQTGISDEDLNNLLLAIEMEVPLNDLFTEDRRFLDYKKIKNLIKQNT